MNLPWMIIISCGEGVKDGKWSPLGWMVRRTTDTPAHCSSGLCLGLHVSIKPASDSTRLSGSNALILSSWHWLNRSDQSEDRAKQVLVKSSKQRESTKGLAIVIIEECCLFLAVVKRRTWGVVIYRKERRFMEGHVIALVMTFFILHGFKTLILLHLMRFVRAGGFTLHIMIQSMTLFVYMLACFISFLELCS